MYIDSIFVRDAVLTDGKCLINSGAGETQAAAIARRF